MPAWAAEVGAISVNARETFLAGSTLGTAVGAYASMV